MIIGYLGSQNGVSEACLFHIPWTDKGYAGHDKLLAGSYSSRADINTLWPWGYAVTLLMLDECLQQIGVLPASCIVFYQGWLKNMLPSGGLYATYHLLREPETTIEIYYPSYSWAQGEWFSSVTSSEVKSIWRPLHKNQCRWSRWGISELNLKNLLAKLPKYVAFIKVPVEKVRLFW